MESGGAAGARPDPEPAGVEDVALARHVGRVHAVLAGAVRVT